ncbi:MAG TPA: DUF1285 domain-containing protein [Candidatus Binatia bacterium]
MPKAGFWAIENKSIRFGRDGRWYADDAPIENQRIADLFSRHVTREQDGSWWLRIGDERAKIVVEDTPYVVTRVDGDAEAGFRITLNDGTSEPLAASSLTLGKDDVLYVDVKGGAFRARFLRAAQAELLSHVEMDGDRFVLRLPSGTHEIAQDAARCS